MKIVGLKDKMNRYPKEVSGGEQQRSAIARALVHRPKILLADEPTGDLDEETEAEVMKFFQHVHKEQGVTLIIVTHSSDIAGLADKRYKMINGQLESDV